MTVREPFSYGTAHRYRIADIAQQVDAELICDEFAWVDAEQKVAHTRDGLALPYDALVLGLGARRRVAVEHAITIDDRHMDDLLNGLTQDVEGGHVHSIAFVSAGHPGWPRSAAVPHGPDHGWPWLQLTYHRRADLGSPREDRGSVPRALRATA